MNQHLNNLKETMDRTVLKEGDLSAARKQKIYENIIQEKAKKKRYRLAPVLSIVLTSIFVILVGGLLLSQLFQSETQNIADSPDNQNTAKSASPNENKEESQPVYEETVYYLPFINYNDPVLDGTDLFVHVHSERDNFININQLIQYDLETGEFNVLYESAYAEANMHGTVLNEDWITWKDLGRVGKSKILVMNRKSDEIKTIVEINDENEAISPPALENNYLAWIHLNNATKQVNVHLHNLLTGETEIIADIAFQPEFYYSVFMRDGKLVWNSHENGKGYYYLYDIDSKTTEKFEEPLPHPLLVKYSNGKFFALSSTGKEKIEGREGEYWADLTLGYLDVKTREFQPFPFDGQIFEFDVYRDNILILNTVRELYIYESKNGEFVNSKLQLKDNNLPSSIAFDNQGNIIIGYTATDEDLNLHRIKVSIVRLNDGFVEE